jgi:hypothetical protein
MLWKFGNVSKYPHIGFDKIFADVKDDNGSKTTDVIITVKDPDIKGGDGLVGTETVLVNAEK